VSARTLGWVLSRGSARWCEALGALTAAPSPAPPPREPPARPPGPPPPASQREKEKGHWGRGRRRGPRAASSRQKIPRRGWDALAPVPAPPRNYREITSNLLGHFRHFPPLPSGQSPSEGRPGLPSWEEKKGPLEPLSPASRPARSEPQN
jgi:hypothetical protein